MWTSIRWSPSKGHYYRVSLFNKRGIQTRVIEGYLDHAARMRTGAVIGFLVDSSGNPTGSAPVTGPSVEWSENK